MAWYKNDHNDDLVDVTGEDEDRLKTLDNWHRAKAPAKSSEAEAPAEEDKA